MKFRDKAGISAAQRAQTFSDAAAPLNAGAVELFETGTGASVVVLDQELDVEQSADVLAALAADPDVEYVEPDVLLSPSSVNPNDPLFDLQWDLWEPEGGANVPAAWATSEGASQVVAVVDTGSTNHSDLNAQMLPGYDLISSADMARDGDGRDSNPQDEGDWSDNGNCSYRTSSWHGTHVAGTVAASTNNGTGMSGVAPGAKILPVRVLGECGGYFSDIADGVIWAAGGSLPGIPVNAHPANVINLSLGGVSTCSAHMQNAVNLANNRNAVVVVAAGNDNIPVESFTPANCQNVIAVGSTGRYGERAPYSNYGAGVDIMAPGGDMSWEYSDGILSTLNSGLQTPEEESYSFYQGTSMAAPHVAGAAALLMAAQPGMTPAQVEARLKATARDLPNGCSPYCGPKLLDVAAAVTVPLEAAPVPTITGTTTVGQTLTAVPGTWAPAPVDLTYQWHRGNTAIAGATAKTYKLTGEDSGQTISVAVTGTKPGYASATKRSTPTAKVAPAALTAPVPSITGTTTVGQTLTAVPGTWAPAPVDLTYQWHRGNTAIAGATATTYKLTGEDSGQTISVAVTGTKPGYASATKRSAATAKVAPAALTAPVPAITGTTTVGQTLTAVPGIWAPAPVDLTYQWHRGKSAIPGATATTYKLTGEDSGQTISVAVTGTKPGYASATKRSAATAKVAPAALTAPVPSITGTTTVGQTLSAVPGTWAPAPVDLTYQWHRGKSAIPGATATTYKLTGEDSGQTISVAVTGTKPGYASATKRSAATAKVAPVPPVTPAKPPFADVPVGMLFYDEILWMANEGISTGWNESNGTKTYRPFEAVNRDAMAAFMYRLAGSPTYTPPKKSPFADVPTSSQFYKEISWLSSRGISTGWTESNGTRTYRPTTSVNRDAMAAFMYRFAESPSYTAPRKSAFRDVPTSSLFYKEISWLASSGISTGWTDGTFRPVTPVARDAMAAFMKRFDSKFGQ